MGHSQDGHPLTPTQRASLVPSAAVDALSYFASNLAIDLAIRDLRAGQFAAWSDVVQNAAADELEELKRAYADNDHHVLPTRPAARRAG